MLSSSYVTRRNLPSLVMQFRGQKARYRRRWHTNCCRCPFLSVSKRSNYLLQWITCPLAIVSLILHRIMPILLKTTSVPICKRFVWPKLLEIPHEHHAIQSWIWFQTVSFYISNLLDRKNEWFPIWTVTKLFFAVTNFRTNKRLLIE